MRRRQRVTIAFTTALLILLWLAPSILTPPSFLTPAVRGGPPHEAYTCTAWVLGCSLNLFQATAHFPPALPSPPHPHNPDADAAYAALDALHTCSAARVGITSESIPSTGLLSDVRYFAYAALEGLGRGIPATETRKGWVWAHPECDHALSCVLSGLTGGQANASTKHASAAMLPRACLDTVVDMAWGSQELGHALPALLGAAGISNSGSLPSRARWMLFFRAIGLRWLWRTGTPVSRAADAFLASHGIHSNTPFLAVHVRHGDACGAGGTPGMINFQSRHCVPFETYANAISSMLARYPNTLDAVVIASDTFQLDTLPHHGIVSSPPGREKGKPPVKIIQVPTSFDLYQSETFIENRAQNSLTPAQVHTITFETVLAVEVLSRGSAFVGTFSSALGRAAFELIVSQTPFSLPPFISLDLAYCDHFVYPESSVRSQNLELCW